MGVIGGCWGKKGEGVGREKDLKVVALRRVRTRTDFVGLG